MDRYLLAPRWLALHLAVVVAVAGCLTLGWWQLGVYRDSQARSDVRSLPPGPIAEVIEVVDDPAAVDEWHDRQVVVEGSYVTEQQLVVPGRVHADLLGSYLVTPLRTDDGSTVPVLRGWVDEPGTPAAEAPDGRVTVTGFLQEPETSDRATVRSDRRLPEGQVAYIAPDQLAARGGPAARGTLPGYLLLQEQSPAANMPEILDIDTVAPIRDVGPWQNLSYSAQWWLFAAAAVVFWLSALRSARRSRRGAGRKEVTEHAPTHVPS